MAKKRKWFARRPRFIKPPGLEHYRFVRLPDDGTGYLDFEVWRDDVVIVGCHCVKSLAEITRLYVETERKERLAISALGSGDPSAMCTLGWHRTSGGAWCRFAAGRSDKLRVYLVGSSPLDYRCRPVWAHEQPPMVCAVCGRSIDSTAPAPG